MLFEIDIFNNDTGEYGVGLDEISAHGLSSKQNVGISISSVPLIIQEADLFEVGGVTSVINTIK